MREAEVEVHLESSQIYFNQNPIHIAVIKHIFLQVQELYLYQV